MTLDRVRHELHRAEGVLAQRFRQLSERHRAEAEVHHVARDLARWSDEHVAALGEPARSVPVPPWLSDDPDPGFALLTDLRRLHQSCAAVSLDWELLAQGAQAARNAELLDLASRCHPHTLRQLTWTNAMLTELSPQILTS